MDAADARKLTQEVKESLQKSGIWCTVTEVNEPELKFIKIEASIKVELSKNNLSSPGGI